MEVWSSIRDYYHLHRREVRRYGFVALLAVVALARGNLALFGACFVAAPVMYAYDRWGEPWRRRGEELLKKRKT